MKKITSLALALALALTLTACGKKDNTAGSGDSSIPADATALLTAVWDAHSEDEKFPAAGGDYENPVEDAPGAVSIADADNLNYMLTLPLEDAGKIDAAASLSHMMNANTFTCGAFHVTSKDEEQTYYSSYWGFAPGDACASNPRSSALYNAQKTGAQRQRGRRRCSFGCRSYGSSIMSSTGPRSQWPLFCYRSAGCSGPSSPSPPERCG